MCAAPPDNSMLFDAPRRKKELLTLGFTPADIQVEELISMGEITRESWFAGHRLLPVVP